MYCYLSDPKNVENDEDREDDVIRRDCEDCESCRCGDEGPLFCEEFNKPVHGDEASYCSHFYSA